MRIRDLANGRYGKTSQWKIPYSVALSFSVYRGSLQREATGKDCELRCRERYDTWTVTEDMASLNFEIECGIKRWMGLNEITEHRLEKKRGWVAYSYDKTPPSDEIGEIAQIRRWFRKIRKYKDQEEYRLAWNLQSPQWENLPDALEIELTRTGLGLFKPWEPPKH